jgi:hypothetical protein
MEVIRYAHLAEAQFVRRTHDCPAKPTREVFGANQPCQRRAGFPIVALSQDGFAASYPRVKLQEVAFLHPAQRQTVFNPHGGVIPTFPSKPTRQYCYSQVTAANQIATFSVSNFSSQRGITKLPSK